MDVTFEPDHLDQITFSDRSRQVWENVGRQILFYFEVLVGPVKDF